MMNKEIINLGIQFGDEKKQVSFEEAEEILLSDRVQTIAEAEAKDDGIVLRRQYYICPDCGKEIPAFKTSFEKAEYVRPYEEDEIREFCSGQLRLFQKPKTFLFNVKISLEPGRYCPYCSKEFRAPEKEDQAILFREREEGRITVTRKMSLLDLWRLSRPDRIEVRDALHLFETVTFDFTAGETSLVIKSGEDTLYETKDPADAAFEEDPLCRIIENKRYLTDRITECFKEYFPEGLPYAKEEMTFQKLRLLTMFTGFNRDFYEGIPLETDTGKPAAEFAPFFEKIRRMEEIPAYLAEKKVPKAKKLRKLLFEKQSFLFYADEICYLWKLLGSADRAMRLLEARGTEFPAGLKTCPGAKQFLEDYAGVLGKEALSDLLVKKAYCALQYGMFYAAGSEARKERERSLFRRGMEERFRQYDLEVYEDFLGFPLLWNVSFGTTDETPYDFDGYLFRRITSSGEFGKAGKELSNCLAGYRGYPYVVGIRRRGHYAAALEIRGRAGEKRMVCQAYEAHNKPIDRGSRLGKAVQRFMERHGLVYEDDEED